MLKISRNKLLNWSVYLFGVVFLGGLILVVATIWIFWQYGRDLPDYRQLTNYSPPVTTRVHAGDGSLLAEYAVEKRAFVPVSSIPKQVINAFLSAEDKNYYQHPGIDIFGVLRALLTNLRNYGKGRRPVGASTITQQVAQNFLLTKEISLKRKIREAIISFRMERIFSKDEILELYLNQIYLGFGSYGVAEAANNYFAKSLDQLILEEVAFLAALPKAPNNYNPRRYYNAAVGRRNYVIGRMVDDGYVTQETGDFAKKTGAKVASDLEMAVKEADIILTCTMTMDPILKGDWLGPGQHVNMIGAYRPDMREADDLALQKSLVFVDSFETTLGHIGELKIPLESGAISRGHVRADYYDLKSFKSGPNDITIFKNGGGAHLDLMTARYILDHWKN